MAALPLPPLPAANERWAVFLDVDGTLLDFAQRPDQVTVDTDLRALLHALHRALDGAMALVSGRSVVDLQLLFDMPAWTLVGQHGWEVRDAHGRMQAGALDAEQSLSAHRIAAQIASRFPGVMIEDKGAAIALHCRDVPHVFYALRDALTQHMDALPAYTLQEGDCVVEIKPAHVDKGVAVATLLHHPPFAHRLPVYVGDDLTDEHAFATIHLHNGVSVHVGSREPTIAHFSLPHPAATRAWLTQVLRAITP